ncbi:MAG: 2-oxoacid:acceptor oxidoreductase subunit alpha, partial [Gammaproteobacteria bacterium]|nr:2-oxoacid:acceptor oxidoreductase subunit alpha [Gammaproteobacteria bacterium]
MSDRPGKSFSVALLGKGGSGVVTAGDMLLTAAARCGLYGLMIRAVGPQIRGGESAALVRLSPAPVECLDDRFDVLLGIDWNHAERMVADFAIDANSIVVTDPAEDAVPQSITASGATERQLEMKALADSVSGGRANMVALGYVAGLAGISREALEHAIAKKLGPKRQESIDASVAAAMLGFSRTQSSEAPQAANGASGKRWMISGNQATGLGALRGGVRFAAAYPITPATEILEWLAPRLLDAGGTLTQAEDELASINMAIGASFGGVPSLTATSGPGLSLMIEGLGLAVCAEIPVVVVDVMRVGPSTGIPTKPEQSDLNAAVYGLHGDAPHIVVAPNSVTDCVYTTQWAVHLAEATQAPVIVLSDQFIGQAIVVADPVAEISFFAKRKLAENIDEAFERYAITADGISPMPIPGTAGGQYTADGLEHSSKAKPSGSSGDHCTQLDKRARKIADFDYGQHWADIEGEGELAILTWGSTTGVVREALHRLSSDVSRKVKLIALRLLLPV